MHSVSLSGAAGLGAPMTPHARAPRRRRAEWPQARLERLRALFDEGLSHLLIAGRLGVGKGLVSAKIARLGWRRGETRVAAVPAHMQVRPPLVIDAARARRLEQLGPEDCHWPTVEDALGVQLFCGCAKQQVQRYCPEHQAIAYRRPVAWERDAGRPATPTVAAPGMGWDRFEAGGAR